MTDFAFGPTDTTPDWFRFSDADGLTCYYGPMGAVSTTTGVPVIDRLHAMPFYTGLGGVLNQIGINVTVAGGAGSLCRVGIYDTDYLALRPRNLIAQSPDYDATQVVFNTTALNLRVPAGQLVWLAYQAGIGGPAPTVSIWSGSSMPPMGLDNGMAKQFGWRAAVTFVANAGLPATFPSTSLAIGSAPPLVVVKWAQYNRPIRFSA